MTTQHAVILSEGAATPVGFALPGIPGRVLADNGGLADPSFQALTALLDQVFGSAQGSLLYRGPAGWAITGPGQIPGTTTNDNAAAGNVGEYVSSIIAIGSAVSLTTGTASNITSIGLTAGDWDVWGEGWFTASGACTNASLGINTSPTALPAGPGDSTARTNMGWNGVPDVMEMPCGPCRISLNNTTTYYLNCIVNFSTGACTAYGKICARRTR